MEISKRMTLQSVHVNLINNKLSIYTLIVGLLILTGCSKNENSEPLEESSANSTETSITVDTSAYDDVIEEYVTFIESYSKNEEYTPKQEINHLAFLVTQNQEENSRLSYTFFDIDNNQIPELIISFGEGSNILDIYTLSSENEPIRLTNEENGLDQIGEKQSITILSDSSLAYYGRGGAGIHTSALFSFDSEGTHLSKTKEITGSIEELGLDELPDAINLNSLNWNPINYTISFEEQNEFPFAIEFNDIIDTFYATESDIDKLVVTATPAIEIIEDSDTGELHMNFLAFFDQEYDNSNGNEVVGKIINMNALRVNVTYDIVFENTPTKEITIFDSPGSEKRTVKVNSQLKIYAGTNELVNEHDALVGDTMYVFYNNQGTISLISPLYAGHDSGDNIDTMMEYVLRSQTEEQAYELVQQLDNYNDELGYIHWGPGWDKYGYYYRFKVVIKEWVQNGGSGTADIVRVYDNGDIRSEYDLDNVMTHQ